MGEPTLEPVHHLLEPVYSTLEEGQEALAKITMLPDTSYSVVPSGSGFQVQSEKQFASWNDTRTPDHVFYRKWGS